MVKEDEIPPAFLHHETCRARLREKVNEGELSEKEADEIYNEWLERRRGDKN